MVYCGKPSKACLPCRKRKLVCDLRRDSCGQCFRAQLTCSGYRDTQALRVRDETTTVRKKVLAYHSTSIVLVPPSVAVSVATTARDIFFFNYVVGNTKGYSFLQTLLISASTPDEHLTRSVDAVALAYLNFQRGLLAAQREARQQYVVALRLTSLALETPRLARKDSTLAAILLLDLYEKITNKDPEYEGAWAAHLEGALSLITLRGRKQFDRPSCLRMLTKLSTNILISCVASERRVPDRVIALRADIALAVQGATDPKFQETGLIIESTQLRCRIKEGGLSDDEAINAILSLDSRFLKFAEDVISSWRYAIIHVDEKSDYHYESFHHVYPHESMTQMWNVFRLTRILLHELLLSICQAKNSSISRHAAVALNHQSVATITQMASEICATVPQYIGLSSRPFQQAPHEIDQPPKSSVNIHDFVSARESNPTHHLPCYRLIHPLYIAAQSPAVPSSLKAWVIKQLLFMSECHAIENAKAVAGVLESNEKRNPWHVYAMLGGYAFVC